MFDREQRPAVTGFRVHGTSSQSSFGGLLRLLQAASKRALVFFKGAESYQNPHLESTMDYDMSC